MRRLISLFLLLVASAIGHDVITTKLTWSREVSRIFYRRCIGCHSAGKGAFPMITYEETRPWAQAVKEEVLARRMPPWSAIKGFGEFKDEAGLTPEEIEIISNWVEGGAPQGEDRLLPQLPVTGQSKKAALKAKTRTIDLQGDLTLKQPTVLEGIRPVEVEAGNSVKVIAERPDGALVPLIWIYNYDPRFARTYYFSKRLSFPKGTRIRPSPVGVASKLLLITSTPIPE